MKARPVKRPHQKTRSEVPRLQELARTVEAPADTVDILRDSDGPRRSHLNLRQEVTLKVDAIDKIIDYEKSMKTIEEHHHTADNNRRPLKSIKFQQSDNDSFTRGPSSGDTERIPEDAGVVNENEKEKKRISFGKTNRQRSSEENVEQVKITIHDEESKREELKKSHSIRIEDPEGNQSHVGSGLFRETVGKDSRFPVEANRYHLYVSMACPWSCYAL